MLAKWTSSVCILFYDSITIFMISLYIFLNIFLNWFQIQEQSVNLTKAIGSSDFRQIFLWKILMKITMNTNIFFL